MTKTEAKAIFIRVYTYREVLRIAQPCYSPAQMGVVPADWRGTLMDIARLRTVPPRDTVVPAKANRWTPGTSTTDGRVCDLMNVLWTLLSLADISDEAFEEMYNDDGMYRPPVQALKAIQRTVMQEATQ